MRNYPILRSVCLILLLASIIWATWPLTTAARTPYISNCPPDDTVRLSLTYFFRYNFEAIDPDPDPMINPIRFLLRKGPGQLDPVSGVYYFQPGIADAGHTYEVEVAVTDGGVVSSGNRSCSFWIAVGASYVPIYLPPIPDLSMHWSDTYRHSLYVDTYDLPPECLDISYSVLSFDPGNMTVTQGRPATINWNPGPEDVGIHTACIEASDACWTADTACFEICVFNYPPEIECPSEGHYPWDIPAYLWGDTISGDVDAFDPDNGPFPLRYSVISFDGPGVVQINPETGEWVWPTEESDVYTGEFTLCLRVDDGANTAVGCSPENADTCCVRFKVIPTLRLEIETTNNSIQGQVEHVDVSLTSGTEPMGGYDLLLAYDRSALNFLALVPGPLFGDSTGHCDWEYSTYRNRFWPSYEPHYFYAGVVRVVAIADMNDGANHPTCYNLPPPYPLFTLDFMVTDNRLFECQFAPIRWFWTDCGNNTISSRTFDTLFASYRVYLDFFMGDIADPTTRFPTYTGVQENCFTDDGLPRFDLIQLVDFVGGGVDIICADSISQDIIGDINLNGRHYEIADAVVFTNYFVYGLSAFRIDVERQIAATDVNRDGVVLDVADLIYLVKIIVGEAQPYDQVCDSATPSEAVFVHDPVARTVSVEASNSIGGVNLEFTGHVIPTLLIPDMEMKWAFDDTDSLTHALVYSLQGYSFPAGPIISVTGATRLVSAEGSTKQGCHMTSTIRSADSSSHSEKFIIRQNYPNPFNTHTVISFELPSPEIVTLEVINVLGEVVYRASRQCDAGHDQLEWNGTDNAGNTVASGVYYYRLSAAGQSHTRKMLLLK